MRKGVIQFYLEDKAYGYIREFGSREEFYFTKNACLEIVKTKDLVSFQVKETKQGLVAYDVQLLTKIEKDF